MDAKLKGHVHLKKILQKWPTESGINGKSEETERGVFISVGSHGLANSELCSGGEVEGEQSTAEETECRTGTSAGWPLPCCGPVPFVE